MRSGRDGHRTKGRDMNARPCYQYTHALLRHARLWHTESISCLYEKNICQVVNFK